MKVRSVGVRRVWDCMLCACVSEEGGDGEGVGSETPSLLSYTLRYVSLAELGTVCLVGLREPMHLCAYMDKVARNLENLREQSLFFNYFFLVLLGSSVLEGQTQKPCRNVLCTPSPFFDGAGTGPVGALRWYR